jgi:hypothetical protein
MVRQQKKPAGLGVLPPGGSGLALNRKGKEKKNSAYPARTHMVDARLEKRQEVKMKRNWGYVAVRIPLCPTQCSEKKQAIKEATRSRLPPQCQPTKEINSLREREW